MISLGLSSTGLAQLQATLAGHHSLRITVQVLRLDGTRMADLSDRFLDGQVNVDSTAAVTRTCTLTLMDPDRSLQFDSDSPSDGAIYLDRMIQVNYSVRPPGGAQVTIPVFTGPLTKLSRSDDVVNIEAQGKEALGMGVFWQPRTYTKGWLKTDVIKSILQTEAGESFSKFTFVESSVRLPADYSITSANTPWGVAKHVAAGMGLHLFYDGRGVARLTTWPQASVFHFRQGDGGTVMSTPDITYSSEGLRNSVIVRGGVPSGQKKALEYRISAPASHPLSPWRLGRNGIPRYLAEVIDNSSIVNIGEAQTVAVNALNQALLQEIDVQFDALPIPHLDEGDVVRIYTDEFNAPFRMTKWSLPLSHAALMSTGYLSRLSLMKSKYALIRSRR